MADFEGEISPCETVRVLRCIIGAVQRYREREALGAEVPGTQQFKQVPPSTTLGIDNNQVPGDLRTTSS